MSAYFASINRGKRSVTVDVSTPEGQGIFRRLAERADVLVENDKVGALARRGLGATDLLAVNPRLVYCSISGFGQDGPYRDRPASSRIHSSWMLEAFAKDGFQVFVGSERFLLDNLRHGGVGCITATGNVNAAAIDRVYAAWQSPDADRLQEELNGVRGLVERLPVIPAVKAVIAEYSGDPAWATVRPPLVPLAPEQRDALVGELRTRGFEMAGLRG